MPKGVERRKMSKIILSKEAVITQKIISLLNKLNVIEQMTRTERSQLNAQFPGNDENFSLLEEVELLTVDLRGYASQIKLKGSLEQPSQVTEQLQEMKIFNIPVIHQFYFDGDGRFQEMKDYLNTLDYLRLSLLEYLSSIDPKTIASN